MRSRLLALALLPLCASSLAACSGGSDPEAAAPGPAASTTPTLPSSAPSPQTSAGAPAAPSAGASSAPAAPAASAPGVGPAPAATPASSPSAAAAAPAPRSARSAGTVPATRAGTYTYDSSGTVTAGAAPQRVSGTSTLTVDAPSGGTQSTVLEGDQGRTETDVVLRADGRYVSRLLLTTPAFSKEFRPATPFLLLPEPAAPGRSWTWTATSTDGKTRVTAKNRVLRAGSVTVGGRAVPTRVVETVLALRGDVVYDGTTTTDEDPVSHLAVRTRAKGKGTISGFAFANDTTSTVRSTRPA